MAFGRQETVEAVEIGDIKVILLLASPQSQRENRGTAEIHVLMSDGSRRIVKANLQEHFSANVISQLISFMGTVRAKAIAEILPEGE